MSRVGVTSDQVNASIKYAQKGVNWKSYIIYGDISLDEEVEGDADFRNTIIIGDLSIGCVIKGNVFLQNALVTGAVSFQQATIEGSVLFTEATINGHVSFGKFPGIQNSIGDTEIKGELCFTRAIIRNLLSLYGCNLGKALLMDHAMIGNTIILDTTHPLKGIHVDPSLAERVRWAAPTTPLFVSP